MLPKVSVIVPVYNVAPYILKCLESLEAQTYEFYEVILINDGSTDNSAVLAEQFIRGKGQFRLVHQENAGVSAARNRGIAESSGEWLTFVDSDDYVEADFLSSMINAIQTRPADLCLAGYRKYYEETGDIRDTVIRNFSYGTLRETMSDLSYIHIRACLYKAAVIKENHLQFDIRIPFGEDRCFVFDYLSHTHRCLVIPDTAYIYRKRAGSATARSVRPEKKKNLYEHVRNFWYAFEDRDFLRAEYARNHHLAHNIMDSFLTEVINAVIARKDDDYQRIATDDFARVLLDNYHHPQASRKQKMLIALLRERHLTIAKIVMRLYYSDWLFKLSRPFLGA